MLDPFSHNLSRDSWINDFFNAKCIGSPHGTHKASVFFFQLFVSLGTLCWVLYGFELGRVSNFNSTIKWEGSPFSTWPCKPHSRITAIHHNAAGYPINSPRHDTEDRGRSRVVSRGKSDSMSHGCCSFCNGPDGITWHIDKLNNRNVED